MHSQEVKENRRKGTYQVTHIIEQVRNFQELHFLNLSTQPSLKSSATLYRNQSIASIALKFRTPKGFTGTIPPRCSSNICCSRFSGVSCPCGHEPTDKCLTQESFNYQSCTGICAPDWATDYHVKPQGKCSRSGDQQYQGVCAALKCDRQNNFKYVHRSANCNAPFSLRRTGD